VHYCSKLARAQVGHPDVHFHDLRHARLTLSAQAGATLAEVTRRAGRSSSAAALRYQHAADQRDAIIASQLWAMADEQQRNRDTDDLSS
jgi:integrase